MVFRMVEDMNRESSNKEVIDELFGFGGSKKSSSSSARRSNDDWAPSNLSSRERNTYSQARDNARSASRDFDRYRGTAGEDRAWKSMQSNWDTMQELQDLSYKRRG